MTATDLLAALNAFFKSKIISGVIDSDMVTITVPAQDIVSISLSLRDEAQFCFEQLSDIAGVDYHLYGLAEWKTERATATGFDRAVDRQEYYRETPWNNPRFAVVYHLLSLQNNQRLRIRAFLEEEMPSIASVNTVWPAANWFEREAFDMFGFIFNGHEDLRRILTDYGFIGHPFRKDFPLSGHVEPRYDAKEGRVIYEAVDIIPRTLTPRIIRHDNRYILTEKKEKTHA